MKLLLDTHILLWAINDDIAMPPKGKRLIMDDDNDIYYSLVSVWEIAIKHFFHPDKMPFSSEEFEKALIDSGYIDLPLRSEHIYYTGRLQQAESAPIHRDPFDRMLIAQAQVEKMQLVTHDGRMTTFVSEYITNV